MDSEVRHIASQKNQEPPSFSEFAQINSPFADFLIIDPSNMGFLSFRRRQRVPAALAIPERPPTLRQPSTLLDRFSQEIGSASSFSSWVIPDTINHCVENGLTSLQSSGSDLDGFGDTRLGLRGGSLENFEDVDPNDSDSFARYLNWIDQGHHDEQYIPRNVSQDSLHNTIQVSSPVSLPINPQSRLRSATQHSIDDSSGNEEFDEFSCCRRIHGRSVGDCDDYSDQVNASKAVSEHDDQFDAVVGSEFSGDETLWDSNETILQSSEPPSDEDVDSWDYNCHLNALYSSDPAEENNNSLNSPDNQVTESDFEHISTQDIQDMTSRYLASSIASDSSISGGSIYEDAVEELKDSLAEQSVSSPTSLYGEDAFLQQGFITADQHYFSPSLLAARQRFRLDLARPLHALEVYVRLQCPPEFNYSWIHQGPSYARFHVTQPSPNFLPKSLRVPRPTPTIFGWKCFTNSSHQIGPRRYLRHLGPILGTGSGDRFPFVLALKCGGQLWLLDGCAFHFYLRSSAHPMRTFYISTSKVSRKMLK